FSSWTVLWRRRPAKARLQAGTCRVNTTVRNGWRYRWIFLELSSSLRTTSPAGFGGPYRDIRAMSCWQSIKCGDLPFSNRTLTIYNRTAGSRADNFRICLHPITKITSKNGNGLETARMLTCEPDLASNQSVIGGGAVWRSLKLANPTNSCSRRYQTIRCSGPSAL